MEGMTDGEWEGVVGVGLTGVFRCLRAQVGRMGMGGSVVLVSSTVGMRGLAFGAHYCVAKHGVGGWVLVVYWGYADVGRLLG